MSKRKNSKSIFWYLVGTLALLIALATYLYLQDGIKTPLQQTLNQIVDNTDYNKIIKGYVLNKQAIVDKIGGVTEVADVTKIAEGRYSAQLTGEKGVASLEFAAKPDATGLGVISNIVLKASTQKIALGTEAVSGVTFFAASTTSAPLKKADYLDGERIIIKSSVLSLSKPGTVVSQSLTVYNEDNEIVATKENVASGKVTTANTGLVFTNKLGALSPGTYHLALTYKASSSAEKEVYWQDLTVREATNSPFVKSVQYYLDAEHTTKAGDVIEAELPVYVRLKLDGFKKFEGKIAGIVDLKIINSEGKVIAQKPRFAAFTKAHEQNKVVVVDGELKLNEPEIYLLSFQINDYYSKAKITHEEKVVVKLK